jgi:hypothetical protein
MVEKSQSENEMLGFFYSFATAGNLLVDISIFVLKRLSGMLTGVFVLTRKKFSIDLNLGA